MRLPWATRRTLQPLFPTRRPGIEKGTRTPRADIEPEGQSHAPKGNDVALVSSAHGDPYD